MRLPGVLKFHSKKSHRPQFARRGARSFPECSCSRQKKRRTFQENSGTIPTMNIGRDSHWTREGKGSAILSQQPVITYFLKSTTEVGLLLGLKECPEPESFTPQMFRRTDRSPTREEGWILQPISSWVMCPIRGINPCQESKAGERFGLSLERGLVARI